MFVFSCWWVLFLWVVLSLLLVRLVLEGVLVIFIGRIGGEFEGWGNGGFGNGS